METLGKIALVIIGSCAVIGCICLAIITCKMVYDEIKGNN